MTIAILDPFSGIAGDMTLGALAAVGLEADWLRALPARLGLEHVGVRLGQVQRGGIACTKVDFEIPEQPHGRGIDEIRELVDRADVPGEVQRQANAAFSAIATAESEIHGVAPERVHLHEVGAVDAILDVVGSVWGFQQLGITRVYCGPIQLGDGTVRAAHGALPVPAPATLKLLEGMSVRTGPDGSGELVTPTGAALVRVLSIGPPPPRYVPCRSGYGAGTREIAGRANALRIILAEVDATNGVASESLVQLSSDIDDMSGEHIAGMSDLLRDAGAIDVVMIPTVMKKGRPGIRVEALATTASAEIVERAMFAHGTTIGVRRTVVERHALAREEHAVSLRGERIRVKTVTLPDGARQAKAEFDDVRRLADVTGITLRAALAEAAAAAERLL